MVKYKILLFTLSIDVHSISNELMWAHCPLIPGILLVMVTSVIRFLAYFCIVSDVQYLSHYFSMKDITIYRIRIQYTIMMCCTNGRQMENVDFTNNLMDNYDLSVSSIISELATVFTVTINH